MTPLEQWYPTLRTVDDTLIGISGALLLFFIPVNLEEGEFALDWDAARRLPWDVLLLLGGGFALADSIKAGGVDKWAGQQLAGLTWHPLVVIAVVSLAVVYLGGPGDVTVGASGAIFGLFGALFAFGFRLGSAGMRLVRANLGILGLNLFMTFAIPGISRWGHIGGLVSGFVTAFAVFVPPQPPEFRSSM